MKQVDLSSQKVVSARDIETAGKSGVTEVIMQEGGLLTPSARDVIARYNMKIVANGHHPRPATVSPNGAGAYGPELPVNGNKPVVATDPKWQKLFTSPEAEAIKREICDVGRKLWQRAYVDGNGGNISYRIAEDAVICTPTLCSKGDLTPADLCLVDLEGKQLAGVRPRTSEILLHLEIYKAQPKAKGVVHCHPPHATAFAITGRVPPSAIIPEFDVFVGAVAMSPYETPGTKTFAQTVIPYVQQYNTILLANHGIVCWADTVTHAEWFAEVLETYCNTLLIAQQIGSPITNIPAKNVNDLLEIKKGLGLPDPRHNLKECSLSDLPEPIPGAIALSPPRPCGSSGAAQDDISDADVDAIVKAVTDAVMASIQK
jgi:L-fuculose-phosphate aldolase